MFPKFDPSLLDDPNFKEDSVREIIIVPILNRLGYTPSGDNTVVRSKSLKHPYVFVGTTKHKIKLIPDYTLMHNDTALMIIDAKSPIQNILDGKNVQQAYSYAIHPEIRCRYFSLCNGKLITVFDTLENKPVFVEKFENFDKNWSNIERYFGHRFLKNPIIKDFVPDLGSHFARLGFNEKSIITMPGCQLNLFGRVTDKLLTASSNCQFADITYCISVDFDHKFLPKILEGLPKPLSNQFNDALCRAPFQAAAELRIELDLNMKLGTQVELDTETFIPFIVQDVLASRFNPTPSAGESANVPKGIFRLSQAYVVK